MIQPRRVDACQDGFQDCKKMSGEIVPKANLSWRAIGDTYALSESFKFYVKD
jgi:hypothetical protein